MAIQFEFTALGPALNSIEVVGIVDTLQVIAADSITESTMPSSAVAKESSAIQHFEQPSLS